MAWLETVLLGFLGCALWAACAWGWRSCGASEAIKFRARLLYQFGRQKLIDVGRGLVGVLSVTFTRFRALASLLKRSVRLRWDILMMRCALLTAAITALIAMFDFYDVLRMQDDLEKLEMRLMAVTFGATVWACTLMPLVAARLGTRASARPEDAEEKTPEDGDDSHDGS